MGRRWKRVTANPKTKRFDRFSGIVIDTPPEVDSNRCELSRSPGSRFFGWKLPSQRIAAPVANSLLSSTLTVAGPLRIRTGFPYVTESQELYGKLGESVKSKSWEFSELFHLELITQPIGLYDPILRLRDCRTT